MPTDLTITSEVYWTQLERINDVMEAKRPGLINRKGVVLFHNNARPYTA